MEKGARENLISYFGKEIRRIFEGLDEAFFNRAEEIRLRVDKPVIISLQGNELSLTGEGKLTGDISAGYRPTRSDLASTMELVSCYSPYAFEEELRNGYLTIPGGHRIGLAGQTVLEGGSVKTIKNIAGINIRIARQVIGCGDRILPCLIQDGFQNTVIISPPACGKTTLLRDLIRLLSYGQEGLLAGQTVGVVDERSELAGCYRGIAQNDLGPRTDVLDGCPKTEGMMMLLRAMSPQVIAVDEIGRKSEIPAIEDIMNAGIKLICTVHGRNPADMRQRPVLRPLLDKKCFKRFVVLKRPGELEGIYDEELRDTE